MRLDMFQSIRYWNDSLSRLSWFSQNPLSNWAFCYITCRQ
ncbi:hypothetical protein ACMD2_15665 [Ananas comosus]|uniref:Uncharacterized protein n=1 Tax=Ananas comosus TaxID=4615 RepID=A0A199UH94_ANACO|nr:hypothetical protein ACMD2_15665 [Ananas comosus]